MSFTEIAFTCYPAIDLIASRAFYEGIEVTAATADASNVKSFLVSKRKRRDQSYERLVDQLLANRQYGERWARHWLDLARYADSDGYEDDLDRPEIWRRSVYAFAKRSVPNPLMEVFDASDSSASCGRRNVTTVPTQALTLLNNEAIRKSAVQFAQRVITEVGLIPDAQIRRAYQLALSRLPTPEEQARALRPFSVRPSRNEHP